MSSRQQIALLAACLMLALVGAPECWRVLREDLADPWADLGRPLAEVTTAESSEPAQVLLARSAHEPALDGDATTVVPRDARASSFAE